MDEVATRLREAGLRATGPRLAVVGALRALGGHRTADEVYAHLVRNDVAHSRMSVYNSLVALAGAGLVLRADVGRGAVLYEEARTWHHHFVCRRCGQVSDVSCAVDARPCLTPREDVGVIDEAQVLFHGTCHRCAEVRDER
ncbi:Fur family transcriptional regulator [Actinomadura sp. DC4]|uniref:Fur family transcriptional regulator n=1 Tax=Actinomadura sp. DC4 TaxID=3055069 RepID=UPI0025B24C90|nr:Fur family transcriptional regulator [Actinomadura sp. DC4]MDN3353736.1 Fur family transcriptional regulator [Actinomadura sp. DC4]